MTPHWHTRGIFFLAGLLFSAGALAAPTGGQVTAGAGNISQAGSATTINQHTDKLAIDWQQFNIGKSESVTFNQPNASSIALNRILDNNASHIYGKLNANGQVFLINPNGVLFGKDAQVNVGSIVASTRDISNDNFLNNHYTFSGSSQGNIINQGNITTTQGGYVALLGSSVINEGTIKAEQGNVSLVAGDKINLNLDNGSLLGLTVDEGTIKALAANGGLIQTAGGQTLLTAQAADALTTAAVNNTGVIEATTLVEQNGTIMLMGDMANGEVNVAGTLNASAPNGGNGGFIETSAATVNIADSATITTKAEQGNNGTWLIDPYDFEIASSGGNITGAALSSALSQNDVTIQTTDNDATCTGATCSAGNNGDGDILVNDIVSWSSNTLTLDAWNDIYINESLNVTGNAGLTLKYGQQAAEAKNTANYYVNAPVNLASTSSFSTQLGNNGLLKNYIIITELGNEGDELTSGNKTLQGIGYVGHPGYLDDNYNTRKGYIVLGNDIDASATSSWNNGAGFVPIGNKFNRFTGTFDGLGHTINDLTIYRPSTSYVGLFGHISRGVDSAGSIVGATIRNVGLLGGSIEGEAYVGGLVGTSAARSGGHIEYSYVTAAVTGRNLVGGLVGDNGGSVAHSYATGAVTGTGSHVGGLVGYNRLAGRGVSASIIYDGSIAHSYATGAVTGTIYVGGLAGYSDDSIVHSYATGEVIGAGNYVGGLAGRVTAGYSLGDYHYSKGSIAYSYATGEVVGVDYVGGLVGVIYTEGANVLNLDSGVEQSYATGAVTGNNSVGGLVGEFDTAGNSYVIPRIEQSYATGVVTGNDRVGGLVGSASRTGGIEIEQSYATGAVIGNDGVGGLVGSVSKFATQIESYATGAVTGNDGVGGLVGLWLGTSSSSLVSGRWNTETTGLNMACGNVNCANALGLTSAEMLQQDSFVGWDISAQGGESTVWRIYEGQTAPLLRALMTQAVGTVDNASKTYDGTAFGDYTVSFDSSVDTALVLGQAHNSNAVNAGTYTAEGQGLYSTQQGYDLVINGELTIDPRAITVTATAHNKVYDGNTDAGISGAVLGAVIGNDDVTLLGATSGSFVSKNAGSNVEVAINMSLGGADAYNYVLTQPTGLSADITPLDIRVAGTASNKVYDGTANAVVSVNVIDDVLAGDSVTFNGTGAFLSRNVGANKSVFVTVTAEGVDAGNYNVIANLRTSASITARDIAVTATADNKVYDGNTDATVNITSADVFAVDAIIFDGTGVFDNKNAGANKDVTVTGIAISGTGASNYNLINTTATTTADVTAKEISVTGAVANNKVYDGTTAANVNGAVLSGVIASDDVTLQGATGGFFASKDAGTNIDVAINMTLGGADAANYELTQPANLTANITPLDIVVTATADNKVYDATTDAVVSVSSGGVLAGDTVTFNGTGVFDNKNVGTGKNVNVSGIVASGADAGNYNITNASTTTTADITARNITATATADNKVYDATTAATVAVTSADVLAGDTVTFDGTGVFDDKNVGTGKSVNVSGIVASGADADNYNLVTDTAATSADITTLDITATATADNKVYDATTNAVVSVSSTDVLAGDIVTFNGTGVFDNKNVGTGKNVNVSGIVASGADAGNYNLVADTATTTANITALDIAVTATADNKIYDGTTAATVAVASADVLVGDTVSFNGTGVFDNKNAGTNKDVTVTGIAANGADAGNYNVTNTTATTTADITAKEISVTGAVADNKVYDGTTAANVSNATLSGVIASDDVTLQGATDGTFASKDAGTNIDVAISMTLDGADAANYELTQPSGLTADITPLDIVVTATADNKVYDATTDAVVSVSSGGVLAGDTVTFNGTGVFDNKNVGTGKDVAVTVVTGGVDASNYNVTNANTTATADITALDITAMATADNKIYDGTTAATVAVTSADVLAGDTVTFNGTGVFDNKNVGTNKDVTVTGIAANGADAGNYNVTNTTATTTADIARKEISVTGAVADNKVYDGTTAANVSNAALSGVIASDDVTLQGATDGTFASKDAGTNIDVAISMSLDGADAANYVLTQPSGLTADITPLDIVVTATADNKVYDATTNAVVSVSSGGVLAGDTVTFDGTGVFDNKNVGTGKDVAVTVATGGVDASNYNVTNANTTTTADITALDIAVTATADNKIYDGTTAATVAVTSADILAGDTVTFDGTGVFDDETIGLGKTVTVSNIAASGVDAGNYNLTNTTAVTTADITEQVAEADGVAFGEVNAIAYGSMDLLTREQAPEAVQQDVVLDITHALAPPAALASARGWSQEQHEQANRYVELTSTVSF